MRRSPGTILLPLTSELAMSVPSAPAQAHANGPRFPAPAPPPNRDIREAGRVVATVLLAAGAAPAAVARANQGSSARPGPLAERDAVGHPGGAGAPYPRRAPRRPRRPARRAGRRRAPAPPRGAGFSRPVGASGALARPRQPVRCCAPIPPLAPATRRLRRGRAIARWIIGALPRHQETSVPEERPMTQGIYRSERVRGRARAAGARPAARAGRAHPRGVPPGGRRGRARHHRQARRGRARAHRDGRARPRAARRRAGRRQDAALQGHRRGARRALRARAVHARPPADGCHRRHHLRRAREAVRVPARARCSRTSSSPTRSTARRPRPSRRCSR